jgi:hypothetical protein
MCNFAKIAANMPRTNPITDKAIIRGTAAMMSARSGVKSSVTEVSMLRRIARN